MKAILILTLTVISFTASANDYYNWKSKIKCSVFRMVDSTYFEEGLSTYEYPDIEVRESETGELGIQYGSHMPCTQAEGDTVTLEKKGDKHIIQAVRQGDTINLEINIMKAGRSSVRVKEEGETRFRTLAYAVCHYDH